jgi:hypothetical protein
MGLIQPPPFMTAVKPLHPDVQVREVPGAPGPHPAEARQRTLRRRPSPASTVTHARRESTLIGSM